MAPETEVILSSIYLNMLKSKSLEESIFYVRSLLDEKKVAFLDKKYEELEQSQNLK